MASSAHGDAGSCPAISQLKSQILQPSQDQAPSNDAEQLGFLISGFLDCNFFIHQGDTLAVKSCHASEPVSILSRGHYPKQGMILVRASM